MPTGTTDLEHVARTLEAVRAFATAHGFTEDDGYDEGTYLTRVGRPVHPYGSPSITFNTTDEIAFNNDGAIRCITGGDDVEFDIDPGDPGYTPETVLASLVELFGA